MISATVFFTMNKKIKAQYMPPHARNVMLLAATDGYASSPIKRSTGARNIMRKRGPPVKIQKDHPVEQQSGLVGEPAESEELKQLRRELLEATTTIAAEKRHRQKQKAKHEELTKQLTTSQRELSAVDKKVETATALVSASEGFNKSDLQAAIAELNAEAEELSVRLKSTEQTLAVLTLAAGMKHTRRLQRDVESIRTNDENKQLAMWRKKVSSAQSLVAEQQQEVFRLRQLQGGSSTNTTAAGSQIDVDGEFEKKKQEYAAQLAKLQDEINREAKQAQRDSSSQLQGKSSQNSSLVTELAHLDQQRAVREAECTSMHHEVERLTKAIERSRKTREAIDSERQHIEEQTAQLTTSTQSVQNKVQEMSSTLNQLIMMCSDAPVMHEKAWAQEKAGLQNTINSIHAKNKSMENEVQQMRQKKDAMLQDVAVESELCCQEQELLKKCDRLRHSLLIATQHQAAALAEFLDDGSQKEAIVRDLEAAVRAEKRKVDEVLSLNERLEKKTLDAKQLLQAHGFDT